MTWDDIAATFESGSTNVGKISDSVSGAYTKVVDVLEKVKLGGTGPAPTPTTAPAPSASEAATFSTPGDGALDRLADSLGFSRTGVKVGVYGLVVLVAGAILWRVFKRGK